MKKFKQPVDKKQHAVQSLVMAANTQGNKVQGTAKAEVRYDRMYGSMYLPVVYITMADGTEYRWNASEEAARAAGMKGTGFFTINLTAFARPNGHLYRVVAGVAQ